MKQLADEPNAKPQLAVRRGIRRLAVVACVLWFGFWWGRAFFAFLSYHQLTSGNFFNQFDAVAEADWYRAVGSLIASVIFPLLLAVAFYVVRWVWKGFRSS